MGEVHVSAELIGVIAAAIALGTAMLASLRGLRQELRDVRQRVDHVGVELRDEMKDLESRLRTEMQSGFKELAAQVINLGDRLSKVEGIIEGMFWGARAQPPDNKREGAA